MSRATPWLWLGLLASLVGCSPGNLDVIEHVPPLDGGAVDAGPPPTLEELQRAYIDLRFGMLVHFGILTYTGTWSDPNLPIDQFNPVNFNPGQWADAAVSAKMKYGVLSVRHFDGFALWNSATTNFDVGNISWRNGRGDVVREFVDAFRARGLQVGFLYAMRDNTQGVGTDTVTRPQIEYIKAQLTELLSNYGPVTLLVFTGWAWEMGHNAVPYQEIRELVKSIQPRCLILDQTQLFGLWDVDVAFYDESLGTTSPADNVLPITQVQKINASGGNDWFWAPNLDEIMSATDIVETHLQQLEPRFTNFLLSCPPNRDGLLDSTVVNQLAEAGRRWTPDLARKPLPAQGPQNEFPYTPLGATATSGTAFNAIDGIDNYGRYTLWQSSGDLPQSITLDLGVVRPDVGLLNYVPPYIGNQTPQLNSAITSYAILTSTDNTTFTVATTGTWAATSAMKTTVFGPVAARYVRLEAREVSTGTVAAATEISVGARR